MDKTALNYANLLGYQESLNLKGQQFNYLSASVFLLQRTGLGNEKNLTYFSGVCWLLLWSIPMWMARWKIPCSTCIGSELHDVGIDGYYHDPMPYIPQCFGCSFHNGYL